MMNMRWLIFLPLVVVMSVFPLSPAIAWMRPDWAALWVIDGALYEPKGSHLISAWLLGVIMDVISDAPLGTHALALTAIAYLVCVFRLRIRLFPMWQQAVFVLVWVGLERLLLMWTTALLRRPVEPVYYVIGIVFTALLWPICFKIRQAEFKNAPEFYNK